MTQKHYNYGYRADLVNWKVGGITAASYELICFHTSIIKPLARRYVMVGSLRFLSRSFDNSIVESVKGMPYEERLRKLKLPTMTYRRARGLMMEVWKHINSYDTAVISPTFQFTRSARYPLQLKRFNSKGSQSKSFYHLAPALWNDLPLAVRETECRNTFKNRLDKHWRGHPMRLDYKASYDLGMRSPADQEEVIYEIASQA